MPNLVPNTQTGSLTDAEHGTNDTLIGVDNASNVLYGDAFEMHDDARGGNDHLTGGAGNFGVLNILVGDASVMDGHTRGGNDTLTGGAGAFNVLYGDANETHDDTRGGNDHLTGADGSDINSLIGDAGVMNGNSSGGNDTLTGAASLFNILYGDAFTLQDNVRGGNDHLTGGDGSLSNILIGDAGGMYGDSRGGNDTLTAGDGSINSLFGDAYFMHDNTRGGDDTLISGSGTDHMWGDAQSINDVAASPTADTGTVATGADTFVFAPGNGNDDINDFRQSDGDRIEVSAYGFTSLVDMMITFDGANTRIDFDANNSVTLIGFADPSALYASDFIFA